MDPAEWSRQSAGMTQQVIVARTEVEWNFMWKLLGSEPEYTLEPGWFAVGIFLGQRPTSGYAVRIVSSQDEAGEHVIRYQETAPSPGAMVLGVLTSPFLIHTFPDPGIPIRVEKH